MYKYPEFEEKQSLFSVLLKGNMQSVFNEKFSEKFKKKRKHNMSIFHLLHAFLVNVLGVFNNVIIQSQTAKQSVSL